MSPNDAFISNLIYGVLYNNNTEYAHSNGMIAIATSRMDDLGLARWPSSLFPEL